MSLGFKPMGRKSMSNYPMIPRGGQVGRLPTRLTGLRIQKFAPRWSTKVVDAGRRKALVFFKETNENDRISNIEVAGANSIHEGILVYRVLLLFWPGASEADLAAFYTQVILSIKVQKDNAYELLAQTHGCSGVGFTGNTSLANYGEAAPGKASSIGNLAIGPGDTFEVRLRFEVALPSLNALPLTIQLEAMADEPIS